VKSNKKHFLTAPVTERGKKRYSLQNDNQINLNIDSNVNSVLIFDHTPSPNIGYITEHDPGRRCSEKISVHRNINISILESPLSQNGENSKNLTNQVDINRHLSYDISHFSPIKKSQKCEKSNSIKISQYDAEELNKPNHNFEQERTQIEKLNALICSLK
jgi:hypothetical protein